MAMHTERHHETWYIIKYYKSKFLSFILFFFKYFKQKIIAHYNIYIN